MKNVSVNGTTVIVPVGAGVVSRVMMPDCNNTVDNNGQACLDLLKLSAICSK